MTPLPSSDHSGDFADRFPKGSRVRIRFFNDAGQGPFEASGRVCGYEFRGEPYMVLDKGRHLPRVTPYLRHIVHAEAGDELR